jgi:hypothetical protein
MVHGKLEVLLVSAKGLEDNDFLSKPLTSLSLSLSFSSSPDRETFSPSWLLVAA